MRNSLQHFIKYIFFTIIYGLKMGFNFYRPVYDVDTGEHETRYDTELARKATDYIVDVCVFDNHFERGAYCRVSFEKKVSLDNFVLIFLSKHCNP